MTKKIAQFFFNNPKIGLLMILGWIVLIWFVAVAIWINGHQLLAVVCFLMLTILFKSQSIKVEYRLAELKSQLRYKSKNN